VSENIVEGYNHYLTGSPSDKAWFKRQFAAWPERADKRYTTNIAFLYGGVQGYRAENDIDPPMSANFRSHVAWHDKNNH